MIVDVVQSETYIRGGLPQDYKGQKVISPVTLIDKEGYLRQFQYGGGVYVRCISDAPVISLEISLLEISGGNYPHLGITAQRGFAYCYRLLGEEQWYNFGCAYVRGSLWKLDLKPHICVPKDKKYELMIYLPSLCYVNGLKLNCGEEYTISPVPQAKEKYLFLGSTISFGIGITSNAFMLSAIFSRKCSSDVTTIAFNYYKYFSFLNEFITAHIEEMQPADVIFWECDHKNFPYELTVEKFPEILDNLLKNTNSRIILWNQPTLVGVESNESRMKREFILAETEKVIQNFPQRVAFCDNYGVWNNVEFDMYAYSSNFINDSGYVWLQKKLNSILEEKGWNI